MSSRAVVLCGLRILRVLSGLLLPLGATASRRALGAPPRALRLIAFCPGRRCLTVARVAGSPTFRGEPKKFSDVRDVSGVTERKSIYSEDRVDERRECRALGEHEQTAQRQHDQDEWREPVFLSLPRVFPQLRHQPAFRHPPSSSELPLEVTASRI